jgi:hypothetical protein
MWVLKRQGNADITVRTLEMWVSLRVSIINYRNIYLDRESAIYTDFISIGDVSSRLLESWSIQTTPAQRTTCKASASHPLFNAIFMEHVTTVEEHSLWGRFG